MRGVEGGAENRAPVRGMLTIRARVATMNAGSLSLQ